MFVMDAKDRIEGSALLPKPIKEDQYYIIIIP